MYPTLLDGDYILVSKLKYGARLPRSIYEIPWVNLLTYFYPFNLLNANSSQPYKKLYINQPIKRNDIIVFNIPVYQKQFAIKRCTKIPGDTIFMNEGRDICVLPGYLHRTINSDSTLSLIERRIVTHYPLKSSDSVLFFPFNYYFVEGDNKNNSTDSRVWGALQEDHVVGKVSFIIFSKEINGSYRWKRMLKRIN